MIALQSDAPFAVTLARFDKALAERGLVPMARIDHADLAVNAGLDLASMVLVLFGNPASGTPLMQSAPSIGIDLPLKMLVWEEANCARVGYTDPDWLAQRHAVAGHAQVLSAMKELLAGLARTAAGKAMPC